MIIAQFGYFGLLITLFLFWNFYKEIINVNNKNLKTILVIIYFYLLIHSLGSSLLTSSTGVFAFVFIAIGLKAADRKLDKEREEIQLWNK